MSILSYLRSEDIVHRDIKPANLLLNEKWQLVLADFGTAKRIEQDDFKKSGVTFGLRKSHSVLNITKRI